MGRTRSPRTRATPLDTATIRRLSVAADVDPRTLRRELLEPGSVTGMAGERARQALQPYRAKGKPTLTLAK